MGFAGSVSPVDMSPVSLGYAAALRGVKRRASGSSFRYALLNCRDIEAFVCLAASNPEGSFTGVVTDVQAALAARESAAARHVMNVVFVPGTPSSLLSVGGGIDPSLADLDYLVADEIDAPLAPAERKALFELAQKCLKPSGLFAYSYRAYTQSADILRFLINEYAPAMTAAQSKEFLEELKALGPLFFADQPEALDALERALAEGHPDAFFKSCGKGQPASSGTFDTLAALLPLGFAFAGSADIGANYMELSTPPSAHDVLIKCREHLLYEPVKDFAMNRLVRHDIWCRLPADLSDDPAELFGMGIYGMTLPREQIPSTLQAPGKTFDLTQPLFANMIEVMSLLPMGIGDFLKHPLGQGVAPSDALEAMQVLVALGVARPMREHHRSCANVQLSDLKWATDFNRYLDTASITERHVLLASEVIGGGVRVSARDALVMQAINRAGMADSASALFSELERIAREPALACQIMDTDPTFEMADNMVQDVISRSMIRWYAYGLLAA